MHAARQVREPVKIGFIGNCYAPRVIGGAELAMQYLAEACRDLGHRVFVVTLSVDGTDSQDEINGVTVYRLAIRNIYSPFAPAPRPRNRWRKLVFHLRDQFNQAAARSVERVIHAEQPDVVSTHNLSGFSVSLWAMLGKLRVPVVHTLHDYHLMCTRTTRFRNGNVCTGRCLDCRAASMVRKAASAKVGSVVGVSAHVLEAHARDGYFPHASRAVVFNGLPLAGGADRSRPAQGPFHVGFIGRVEEAKGVEVLLQAVERLPDVDLVVKIAGKADPAYLSSLRHRYPDPRVRYVGYVDAPDFYRGLDLVVVPSRWEEPLGHVVIEPWEYGVPVVGSRIGGIRELIDHGATGLLVEPGDAEGFATAIASIRDGVLGRDAAANCRRARERFLPEHAARQMCERFEQAIAASA